MQNSGPTKKQTDKTKVFLSYSRKDREFVAKLAAELEAHDDIEVFKDTEDILPTEEWRKRLEGLIGEADAIVFCLSPDSATSEVCAWEVEYAESLNKRIAPIVLREVDGAVPGGLAKLNYIFFTERDDFGKALTNLVTALNTDINWIREHTRIGELARRWVTNDKPNDELLRGDAIEAVEQWSGYRPTNAPELTEDMVRFIEGSRSYATTLARRIRTIAASIVLILAGVVTGFLTWKIWLPPLDAAIYRAISAVHAERDVGASFTECSFCPEMVVLPTGKFEMGSPDTEKHRSDAEGPQHEVIISSSFAVGKFEVTFEEWDACVTFGGCSEKGSDSEWGRGRRPVSSVEWKDAQQYVDWLSDLTGSRYRLLSEAEWEYAARAGTTTPYSFTGGPQMLGEYAWFSNPNSDHFGTQIVGQKKPNAFGLYDMHGNVWEWVEDCNADDYSGAPTDGSARKSAMHCRWRLLRGGSFYSEAEALRSANRYAVRPERDSEYGFRVARDIN